MADKADRLKLIVAQAIDRYGPMINAAEDVRAWQIIVKEGRRGSFQVVLIQPQIGWDLDKAGG